MVKIVRDPLVHFLLIGAALFAVLSWLGEEPNPQEIRVTEEALQAALRTRLPSASAQPSRAELDAIVDSLIRDEVYYREALALGLDVDDDQVRTRLIEKMRYLSEDTADPQPGDEQELREFYAAAPERFAIPAAVSFDQVFFSPSQRGAEVRDQALAALQQLTIGGDPAEFGDSTPLGERFSDASADRLSVLFGPAMTESVFALPLDVWSGPFESDFGLHLVRVTDRRAARQPNFDEARSAVLDAYAQDKRAQLNEAQWQAMRERYDVVVDWPDELEVTN